jgi:hypothetical protein
MNGPGMGYMRAERGGARSIVLFLFLFLVLVLLLEIEDEDEYDSITSASLDLRVLGPIFARYTHR